MPYEFSSQGATAAYADVLNQTLDQSTVTDAMIDDFRQFIIDNFTLSTEQRNYLDAMPDEVFE